MGDAAAHAGTACADVTIPAELALSFVTAADGIAIAPQRGTFAILQCPSEKFLLLIRDLPAGA